MEMTWLQSPKQRTNLSQDNKQNRGKKTVAQGPAGPFLPRHRKGARAGPGALPGTWY